MSGPTPGKPGKGRGRRSIEKEELVGQFVEVRSVWDSFEDSFFCGCEGSVQWVGKVMTEVAGQSGFQSEAWIPASCYSRV